MSESLDIGLSIASTIAELTTVPASFAFVPSYAPQAGPAFVVSPVSSSYTKEARDGGREALTFQAVLMATVNDIEASTLDPFYVAVETLKSRLPGAYVSTSTKDYYISGVISSGSTALSSSEIEGGLIDSKQLGECCLFQSPIIIELIRYK